MTPPEPRLTPEDTRIWERWSTTCLSWAETAIHQRRVAWAIDTARSFLSAHPDAYVACSGGKDSVALADLVVAEIGSAATRVMHTWDEFSMPDIIEYLTRLCRMERWRIKMDVVYVVRGQEILRERAKIGQAWADDDYCSRTAVKGWFSCVADYAQGRPVLLGLRKEESSGRLRNLMSHGATYEKADGQWVCNPLVHWEGIDVYAYLMSRNIEMHPVYRCCRLSERPDRVRLNGWLPGAHSRKGAMIWLRTYYPSLYLRLSEILPDAKALT